MRITHIWILLWLASLSFPVEEMYEKKEALHLLNEKIFDIESLKTRFDGDMDFISDLLRIYPDSINEEIKELLLVYKEGNRKRMKVLIYSLGGTAMNICAEEMSKILGRIYFYLLENKDNSVDLNEMMREFSEAFCRTKKFVEQIT